MAERHAIGRVLARRSTSLAPRVLIVGGGFAGVTTALELAKRRSEEHTSELQSRPHLVCRLLLEKKKNIQTDALAASILYRRTRSLLLSYRVKSKYAIV